MNLSWKRSLLALAASLAASLALTSAASAQAPHISASQRGHQTSANLRVGSSRISVGFGQRYRKHGQAPSGYWKNVNQRVWIPGHARQVWAPDRFGWVYDSHGRKSWSLVERGHYYRVQDSGRYEWQLKRIWVSYKTHSRRGRSARSHAITRRH